MLNEYVYIGIDVAKATLELSPFGKGKTSIENTRAGIASLLRRAQKADTPVMLCCEATGGYEKLLIRMALEQDVPIALLNAKAVRDFAKSKGILAKTDRIDALVIKGFAQQNSPRLIESPTQWQEELKALVSRREALILMREAERNRLDPIPEKSVVKSIRRLQKHLDKEVKSIEEAVEELIANHPALKKIMKRLQQVKSIGPKTAQTLIAVLPELGKATDKQIVALAGLAPYTNESGTYRGLRRIQGGRAQARRVLYMAALVAIVHNPILKEFYWRLKERGKPSKVALTAVMRKLVVLANRIMSDPDFIPA